MKKEERLNSRINGEEEQFKRENYYTVSDKIGNLSEGFQEEIDNNDCDEEKLAVLKYGLNPNQSKLVDYSNITEDTSNHKGDNNSLVVKGLMSEVLYLTEQLNPQTEEQVDECIANYGIIGESNSQLNKKIRAMYYLYKLEKLKYSNDTDNYLRVQNIINKILNGTFTGEETISSNCNVLNDFYLDYNIYNEQLRDYSIIKNALNKIDKEIRLKYFNDIKSYLTSLDEEILHKLDKLDDIKTTSIDIEHKTSSEEVNEISGVYKEDIYKSYSVVSISLKEDYLTKLMHMIGEVTFYDWFFIIDYIVEELVKSIITTFEMNLRNSDSWSKDSFINALYSNTVFDRVAEGFKFNELYELGRDLRLQICGEILNKPVDTFSNEELKINKIKDRLNIGIRRRTIVSIPTEIVLLEVHGQKYLYKDYDLMYIDDIQYEVYEMISKLNLFGTIQCLDKYSYDSIIGWCNRNNINGLKDRIININKYVREVYGDFKKVIKDDIIVLYINSSYIDLNKLTTVAGKKTRLI